MTPLVPVLLRRISTDGPLSIAQFMAECLLHPEHGYYTTRDPLGAAGDFTTAPEISQMFGELVGLALAQAWLDQGSPAPFALAEPGPGRGTLMADMLRATARVPGFHAAARIHLVEASPVLRARQRAALAGHRVSWHDSLDSLPQMPLFLVANEFFDALPIRQFRRVRDGWSEIRVTARDGGLAFAAAPPAPQEALAHRLHDTRPGDIVEICPSAPAAIQAIAGRIHAHGGAAIVIDYGGWRSLGDTLQAVRNHASEPVLANPGRADLTAHVDFEALSAAAAAAPARVTPMTAQGMFLARLGIAERARNLARAMTGATLDNHHAAFQRLTDPGEMGSLFKTIAIYPQAAPAPPGYDP